MMNQVIFKNFIQANNGITKRFGVKQIGLFGSAARGEARETSDIDDLVQFYEGKKHLEISSTC